MSCLLPLASAWPTPGSCGHLGSEPANVRYLSLFLCLSLYLSVSFCHSAFFINKFVKKERLQDCCWYSQLSQHLQCQHPYCKCSTCDSSSSLMAWENDRMDQGRTQGLVLQVFQLLEPDSQSRSQKLPQNLSCGYRIQGHLCCFPKCITKGLEQKWISQDYIQLVPQAVAAAQPPKIWVI